MSYNVKFLDFRKLYTAYPEVEDAIKRVLLTGKLILQEDVESFERRLAEFLGKKYAVGLNSGTDAIYMSLKALGIGPGDEVITSAHTFKSTAGAIVSTGATPVLVDIDDNGLMDKGDMARTEKTKAIIPVHLTGNYVEEFDSQGIHVIEDACQAIGAKGVGYGIAQAYSFYPAKILGSFGDAGALVTDDEELAKELKDMRNHYKGTNWDYGVNSRLDNLQAAVLLQKMDYLGVDLEKRKVVAGRYLQELKVGLPYNQKGRVWQDFIIKHPQRDKLYTYLADKGIETMKNEYPFTIHVDKRPKAKKYEAETLRIPCNQFMSQEDIDYVIDTINLF